MSTSNIGAAATTATATNNNANKDSIDLDLYSRQLYVLGLDTLISLSKTNVLILGLKGLGAEVAKNLILAGPNSVHIHDDNLTEISDLSSQFYLTESDVGKKRSLSCVNKLSELNPYVKVKAIEGEITAEIIKNYQIVVDTNTTSFESARKLNVLCRSVGVRSIFSATFGLYGFCFVDFVGGGADLAEEFVVTDHNGEEYRQLVVSSITLGNPATVHVHEEKRHDLETGDWIIFEDLDGFSEINDGKPIEVIVKGPHSFELKDVDSTNFKPFVRGFVRQAKKPVKVKFDSLAHSIEYPGEFLLSDFGKFGRAEQLHIALQALFAFNDKNGNLPRSHNKEDAAQVIALAKEINEKAKKTEGVHSVDEVEESLVEKLAQTARGNLNPTAAFFGGIVAQEVLKLSGKFHPIKQWFHFDAFECLPDTSPTGINAEPTNTRYDGQIAVFGREFQQILLDTRVFLVGCGALGCEFLKNFALMGLSCGERGMLNVTDMDNIEKSNLNRQFLFRDKNIGQMKAIAATAAAQEMNNSLKITARTDAVGTDTENIFNEEFWNSQDIIVNALDNIKARLYVDSCCVIHKKPLFESGTLGTKANTQVILPYKTESYGSTRDPPETSIPMCTLKNFPYQIEHTIEWARDYFGGVFTFGITEVNNYLKNPEEFFASLKTSQPHIATQRETLSSINETLLAIKKGVDFSYCVEWARFKFEDLFVNKIKQLLFNFPVDHRDSSGQLFWSGLKRAPKPLVFSPEEPTHFSFILAASNLLAHAYGVKGSSDANEIKKILAGITVTPFEPRGGVVIKESETSTAVEGGSDDIEVVERLTKEIPPPSSFSTNFQLVPEQFEKDDDSNFHIDFITATSNLRAINYEIRDADRNKTKQIAGKIIPAIATTTAMITGLVCMELYKYLQKKPLDAFRNAFVNLALPLFAFSEPVEPQKHTSQTKTEPHTRAVPEGWTLWDTLVVEGDLTFQELNDYFRSKHQLNVTSVAAGTSLIYNAYIPKYKARLPMKISEVWKTICGDNWDPSVKTVDMSVETELEEDDTIEVDLPVVRVKFC